MNKIARFLLTASSIAPVGITLIFIGYMKNKPWLIWWSLGSVLLVLYQLFFSYTMQIKPPSLYKNVETISPANKEVTNYFLSYLFPLLGTDSIADKWQYAVFFYISLIVYICFSENYNFNPLISALGFKFYEAEDDTGVGFVLISKEVITNLKNRDFEVIQLTDYTFMHVTR